MSISEADWKIYKRIYSLAADRYSQRLLDDAARICGDETRSSQDRHIELSRLVRDRDKEMGRIFDGLGRSSAAFCLVMMRHHKLVTDDELESFSLDLQQAIQPLGWGEE